MGKRIGLTMRIVEAIGYNEPRDCIAENWAAFMRAALPSVQWLPIPNLGEAAGDYAKLWDLEGFILTGGEDIGKTPLRDTTEGTILALAVERRLPVLGVCRGMQMIQSFFGGDLEPCDAEVHVARRHGINILPGAPFALDREKKSVNSFHRWAVMEKGLAPGLKPFALAEGGLVEALYHPDHPIAGIQWHPERAESVDPDDRTLIRQTLQI